MAEWREKGYVADSDEEDDSQESSTNGPGIGIQKANGKDDAVGETTTESVGARPTGEGHSDDAGGRVEESSSSDTRLLRVEVGVQESGVDKRGNEQQGTSAETQLQPIQDGGLHTNDAMQGTGEIVWRTEERVAPDTSGASSPLSEAPSSLPDLPAFLRSQVEEPAGISLSGDGGPSDHAGPIDLLDHDPASRYAPAQHQIAHNEFPRAGRTFRHRNAIQLHPYVIEKEKFNQTWRARGLKPVHILQEEAAKAQAQEAESQNFEPLEDDKTPTSSPRVPTDSLSMSQSPRRDEQSHAEDGDLPDIHDLLQGTTQHFASLGHKRRRVGPKFKKPPKLAPRKPESFPGNLVKASSDDGSRLYDVPPSPPLSPPLSESQTLVAPKISKAPQFRVPPRAKTSNLPTPLTSSEPRKRHSRVTMIEDGSDEASSSPQRATYVLDIPDSSSEDEVNHQLQRAQRRIKGVLPASWLKLDLKTQAKPLRQERSHPMSAFLDKGSNQRGVARTVSKDDSETSIWPASRQEDVISSDGDTSEPDIDLQDSPVFLDAGPLPTDLDEGGVVSRMGEAMEADRVEPLLPTVKRSKFKAPQSRKRQKKLVDFGVRGDRSRQKAPLTPATLHAQEPRIRHQLPKTKRRPRFRPPNLSILDATGCQITPQKSYPAFMRVARRTARLRPDKARHSPSRKTLRLATREDTYDVNETVRAWRERSIAPILMIGAPTLRTPLHPRSANDAARATYKGFLSYPKQTKLLLPTGKQMHSRLRSSRTTKLPSSLAKLVSRHPHPGRSNPCLDSSSHQVPHQAGGGRTRGQLLSNLKASNDRRPAVLEWSQTDQENLQPEGALEKRLSISNDFDQNLQIRRPVLDRFLRDDDPLATIQKPQIPKPRRSELDTQKDDQYKPARARKRRPRRWDTAILHRREPTPTAIIDEIPDGDVSAIDPERSRQNENEKLRGLGPFGTSYTVTFDVRPLPPEASFSNATFLGSGGFRKSLTLQADCDLENFRGVSCITYEDRILRWGAWNEIVSSEMGEVFKFIEQGIRSVTRQNGECDTPIAVRAITLLTAVISYLTSHLSFSDAVDRLSFLRRCNGLLSAFWSACGPSATCFLAGTVNDSGGLVQYSSQIALLALVLANQLRQISKHSIVPLLLTGQVEMLLEDSVKETFLTIPPGLKDFEQYLVRSRHRGGNGRPLPIDLSVVEAFVITHHILRQANIRHLHILEFIQGHDPELSTDTVIDLGSSERAWQQLFALLPFLELNAQGTLDVGRRFEIFLGHWMVVKRLINPILEIYLRDPYGQAPGFNAYCRCLFSRCLHLINEWGWYGCDSIIGTFFDFFAQNGLGHLRNEESHGSPQFLEDLSKNPSLEAKPEDLCFHLLLKIIGSGIKHMQTLHSPKKIRDLVWRLMPNHGRSHPKDQAVRQEDLDALRNHHDLLCTLYWASPPDYRPSLNGIRNLVDFQSSHREACHINIRAWFNLVKFQLSTDEPVETLEYFAHWHADFLKQMIRQHGLARAEAEGQVRSAFFVSGLNVSKDLLEATIAKNQRQVEAVLDDALVCLNLAIGAARTQKAAGQLLSPALTGAFGLFDRSKGLANGIVVRALDVLLAYSEKCPIKKQQMALNCDNDDSQDYGDWSALYDDNSLEEEQVAQASSPLPQISGPLRTLVSNCFGADAVPSESLLTKLIDTWVAVSDVLVHDGAKTWDDYLGQFGFDAWHTLRDTDQSRKYAAYFFSSLIDTNVRVYRENRLVLLKCWLGSLVERESMLKFQHKFTSSLLNAAPDDPLLVNLPFWRGSCSASFSITAVEFLDRRLSLISSVLSNMRTSLNLAYSDLDTNAAQLRAEYQDLLKHLMTQMKQNYLALGQGSNFRGAYVDFLHCVVESLQEHTSSIGVVDRFFTDSSTFPLPTSDPNYVVGKLKSYGTRLSDPKMQKEVVVFLQSVSERAAADRRQDSLVMQLQTAMSSSLHNAIAGPTLCALLAKAIVPAYIQVAFKNSVGWVFAVPFLKALQKVFKEVHLGLNGCDRECRDECMSVLMTFLIRTRQAVNFFKDDCACFESVSILKILTAYYRVIIALLPTLDYMLRLGPHKSQDLALELIAFYKSFAAYAHAIIAPLAPTASPQADDLYLPSAIEGLQYEEVHSFAVCELQDTLKKHWTRVGDDYFVMRGSSRQHIMVDVRPCEEERDAFRLVLHDFGECLSAMLGLGGWEEWSDATRSVQTNMDYDVLLF